MKWGCQPSSRPSRGDLARLDTFARSPVRWDVGTGAAILEENDRAHEEYGDSETGLDGIVAAFPDRSRPLADCVPPSIPGNAGCAVPRRDLLQERIPPVSGSAAPIAARAGRSFRTLSVLPAPLRVGKPGLPVRGGLREAVFYSPPCGTLLVGHPRARVGVATWRLLQLRSPVVSAEAAVHVGAGLPLPEITRSDRGRPLRSG